MDHIHQAIVEEDIRGPRGELVRIEMFAHGALCMAVSGKCYLSLHEMNSSANRGACNQICRRSYLVKDTTSDMELEVENQYIMSPKDLKTIHFMNKMMDCLLYTSRRRKRRDKKSTADIAGIIIRMWRQAGRQACLLYTSRCV